MLLFPAALALLAPLLADQTKDSLANIHFAAGPKDAVGILPPEKAFDARVLRMSWSPTGRVLLAEAVPDAWNPSSARSAFLDRASLANVPPPPHQLLSWMPSTGKTTIFLTAPPTTDIEQVQWIAGSETAVVVLVDNNPPTGVAPVNTNAVAPEATGQETIVLVTPATGKIQTIFSGTGPEYDYTELSPKLGLGALIQPRLIQDEPDAHRHLQVKVTLFSPQGLSSLKIPMPMDAQFGWDGVTGLPKAFVNAQSRQTSQRMKTYFDIDLQTGKLSPGTPIASERPSTADLMLYQDNVPVQSSDFKAKAGSIWLSYRQAAKIDAGVISTEGSDGLISPTEDAVAYRSNGAVYIRRLFKISRAAYDDYMVQVAKDRAIDDAKQTALAMIMYASDMDGNLPDQKSGWLGKLDPYLKDSTIGQNFTYTFAGGSMSTLASPGQTIMGYISAPGGRAVAYMDGHVRWIPNP